MKTRLTRTRTVTGAAIAIVVTLLLTACGATIDTTMTVNNDGSGTRVMTLTLDKDDTSKLTGGTAAVDASIRKNLPSQLTYSGASATADGGMTAKVTLTFSSTADYKAKVQALIDKSTADLTPPEFTISDSTLVQGINLNETFSSSDLLSWLFQGLLDDGIIPSDTSNSDLSSTGMTYLDYDGQHINNMGGELAYQDVQNHGFDTVSMVTTVTDQTDVFRTITFEVGKDRLATDKARLEKYFTEATPVGAKVETGATGVWKMTFAGTPATITKDTSTALGGSPAKFTLDRYPVRDDASQVDLEVNDSASCDVVCYTDPDGYSDATVISDHLIAGQGYTPKTANIDTSSGTGAGFRYSPPITSLTSNIAFGTGGGVTSTTTIVVPATTIATVGRGFETQYRPTKNTGVLSTTKTSKTTTYKITISGDTLAQFTDRYKKWNSRASITAGDTDTGFFIRHSAYDINPGLSLITDGHPVTGKADFTVSLPFGRWATDTSTGDSAHFGLGGQSITTGKDLTVSARTSGPTLAGTITAALIAAALAFGIILIVRRRKTVMARLGDAKGLFDGAKGRFDGAMADHAETMVDNNVGGRATTSSGKTLFSLPALPPRTSTAGKVFNLPATVPVGPTPSALDLPLIPTTASPRPSLITARLPHEEPVQKRTMPLDITNRTATTETWGA